jgi:dephospho-CoA kinase
LSGALCGIGESVPSIDPTGTPKTRYMKVVGLTGGIATGKSTVSKMLRQRGIPVIDADAIAREVVRPGTTAWKKIRQVFGPEVISEDGEIDRAALGKIVFEDPRARAKLNRITHPFIYLEILAELARHIVRGDRVVVLDAALLFETVTRWMVHSVIVVYTDPATQIRRLMDRNGYTPEEAAQRIEAQIPLEEKCRRADYVIDNSGPLEDTERQLEKILSAIVPGRCRMCLR